MDSGFKYVIYLIYLGHYYLIATRSKIKFYGDSGGMKINNMLLCMKKSFCVKWYPKCQILTLR